MTSRTPVRLTPHRGPLATPSTSPESSPTLSTPPTDISYCSTAIRPVLDVAILQHRISTLSPPTRHPSRSHLHRRRRDVIKKGPFRRSTRLSPLPLVFDSPIYLASELAKSLAGIVTFCLLIWGLLEWVISRLLIPVDGAEPLPPVVVRIRTISATRSLDISVTVSPSIPHEGSALPCQSLAMRTKRSTCCGFAVSF